MSPLRWFGLALLLAVPGIPARAADVCSTKDLHGAYGFQLTGETTISGTATPVAGVARIVFEEEGSLSGSSSVNFNGLLLGNPVTGTYEIRPDCTMSFSLQDDSGAFQHFSGVITGRGKKVEFQQTEPGAGPHGIMKPTADGCKAADIHGRYAFTLSGISIPMDTGGPATEVSNSGQIDADGKGTFALKPGPPANEGSPPLADTGTFEVDGDCFVRLELGRRTGGGEAALPIKLRGIAVDGGREILAIQTDPGATVSARFTAVGRQ